MAMFTIAEYCDMHFLYGAAFGNASEARRLYSEYFPNRQCPSAKTFTAVHNRLHETGTVEVSMVDTGVGRSVRSVEFVENVLHRFEENPHLSTRAVSSEFHTSKNSVWRVLNEEGLYPYHLQKVHGLVPRDYPRRVDCSRWFMHKLVDNPDFLKSVLFTDEASFNQDGIFNTRNSHVWASENPHETKVFGKQHRFSVNVWAGVLGDNLIGPYILPNRLNSPTYLVFLRDILPELLDGIPLADRINMWLQHDGAPAHFGDIVRDFLNDTYHQQWIGRGGPVSWPPRSPDLTPLDFYVWGTMKQLVYSTPVESEVDLIGRIVAAAAVIQENNKFEDVRQSMSARFTMCNRVGGGHIEHQL
jgi:hypothetical protein